MIKIIQERTHKTITEYHIEFQYEDDPNSGFCFPANKDHTPALEQMCPEAIVSYNRCLNNDRLIGPKFTTNTYSYTEPAIGRCICGSEVVLDSDYMGAVQCECGRWYNIFGQSLRDPKYWEED